MSDTKAANPEQDRALLVALFALASAIARMVDAHLQENGALLNPRLATGALMACLSDIVERHPEIAPDTAVLARWYADDFDAMAAQFAAFTDTPTPQPAA